MTECRASEWEDIGHGVSIQRRWLMEDGAWRLNTIAYKHGCTHPGDSCIPVSPHPSGKHWTLESEDPLTLSPSLLCMVCQHHGFIQAGKWVPA
jgi:hypothetical protein